ncbi:MAG TPA: hypothetical protein VKB75_08100 [Jatrophihabitans sp.]|nr:hypothetical protein [Jatrophihabitans sp.]
MEFLKGAWTAQRVNVEWEVPDSQLPGSQELHVHHDGPTRDLRMPADLPIVSA